MVNPVSHSWTAGYMEPRGYMENRFRYSKKRFVFYYFIILHQCQWNSSTPVILVLLEVPVCEITAFCRHTTIFFKFQWLLTLKHYTILFSCLNRFFLVLSKTNILFWFNQCFKSTTTLFSLDNILIFFNCWKFWKFYIRYMCLWKDSPEVELYRIAGYFCKVLIFAYFRR